MTKTMIRYVLLTMALLSSQVFAAGRIYNQQVFENLISQGKTVVVHIHADWCGTCKAQDVQINAAMNAAEFKDVTFLEVDYDGQRKSVTFFKAKIQSTIIIFKNGKEIDRSAMEREAAELQAFLKKAL
jgi:thiol-disulfide isomerase/thioredoxin